MKKILLLVPVVFLTGCHPIFCRWDLGYSQMELMPAKNKVIGVYQLSDESSEYLDGRNQKWTPLIELMENGVLKYQNNNKIIKTGTWNISCGKTYKCVIDMEERVVPFAEKNGRFAFLITIGDGDQCKGLVYEKMES